VRVILAVCATRRYFGMPKYYYYLGKHLKANGVDVSIVIDSPLGIPKLHEVCDIPVTVLQPEVRGSFTTLAFAQSLAKYLRTQEFDILHTCHVLPFWYLMEQHKPVVFQPFGNELFTLGGKGLNALYCKMAQPVLRYCGHNCEALAAEGDFQFDDMRRWYDNPRMYTIPIGIDTSVIPRTMKHNGALHILAVNSLYPYDGLDVLIEAFRYMNYVRESTLTIVGSGPCETELKRQARGLPISFQKQIPESALGQLYQWADVFVSTSRQTDIQMGILEAEAAGLPIVSVGQRWLVDGNGMVVDFTPSALMDGICKVASDDKARLGQRSIELVKPYDFKEVTKAALGVYEKVLA